MPEMQASQMQRTQSAETLVGRVVGRFLVQKRLADGGMGEVYCAEDTVLKREVALKRIAPHLSRDPHFRDRFLKEAERASKFSDPHVVAIYDCFTENDELYLVMEFVEGEDLRERFGSPITLQEFLSIARQCLEGLKAAHCRGILHCDIKPENIMIGSTGQVKILDFGLAKRLPNSLPGGGETKDWRSLQHLSLSGTPGYIAPEILLDKIPDQRADLFSLGVVFYESLAGQHPFSGSSPMGASARTLTDEPRELHQIAKNIPVQLESVIVRMLEKDPEKRYATAAEVLADLDKVQIKEGPLPLGDRLRYAIAGKGKVLVGAAVIVLLVFVGFTGVQMWRGRPGTASARDRQLAILPFTATEGDASLQALTTGMTETLNAKLSQLTERYPIQVVPSGEVRAQSVSNPDEARKKLGATLVLQGSTQQAHGVVRINYSLIDTRTHTEVHADSITADASDPFAVEDRVVESVVDALNLELAENDRTNLAHHSTKVAAAYNLYLRGIGYLRDHEKPENVDNAIDLFQQALDSDSKYDLAYAGLGESYWYRFNLSHDSEWLSKATEACQMAVKLGPSQPKGYVCLGEVHNQLGKYEEAAGEFRRALDLDSTNDDAYLGLGNAYDHQGKMQDAEETFKRAIRLKPGDAEDYTWLGRFYASHGRFDEAIKMYQQATAISPDNFDSYSDLGGIYVMSGRYAEAIPFLQRSAAIRPSAAAFSNLGAAFFFERKFPDAAHSYQQATALDDKQFQLFGNLAEAYYWTPGQMSRARANYDKAIELAQQQMAVNPKDAEVNADLGLFYAMIGSNQHGKQYIETALTLAPKDPAVLYQAASVYAQMDDKKEVLDLLSRALAAGLSTTNIQHNPIFDRYNADLDFKKAVGQ